MIKPNCPLRRIALALAVVNGAGLLAVIARADAPEKAESTKEPIAEVLRTGLPNRDRVGTVVTVGTEQVVCRIRAAKSADRSRLLEEISANLEATELAMARVRREGRDMKSEGRARFNEAYDRVRAEESALRQAVRQLRHVEDSAAGEVQERLAVTYQSYADAVANATATVRGAHVADAVP